ncbi:SBBP repeat-containing protein [Deltaproteobacteria bacterium]|nr:SBBP repeat-containing protein [Deltaproteobacteria bacterium]
MPKTPMVNHVRYILIIFSVIFYSLTVISCKSSDDDVKSSTSSKGLFVTVGDNGIILTSSDGNTWDKRNSGTTNNLSGVTYVNSTFLAAGASGTILTSANGTAWTSITSGTTNNLSGVTYGNSTLVMVGDNGTILTSADGTSWTKRTSGTSEHLYGVTNGDGLFVVVGENATILTSSDGTTWTERDGLRSKWAIPKYLKGVTYRKKLFVAVGRNGLILNSPDGTTWKERKSGIGHNLLGVTYANGIFVSVGKNGKIVTSFDGNWWVKRTYVLPTWLNGVTYGNSAFVTVGDNGVILTSSDGISWTKRTSGDQTTTTNIVSVSDSGGNIQIESTNHSLDEGDVIRFTTTNTLPTGLAMYTDYYVVGTPATNTFFVSEAESGTPIVYTDAGTGTHSWQSAIALNRSIEQYDVRPRSSFSVTSVTTNSLSAITYSGSASSSSDGLTGTYQLANNDYANGVATDSSGNVYVTGGTKGGLDGNTSSGDTDLFVIKYNSSGTKQWTKQLGSTVSDYANGISIDSSGNVYVAGATKGGLDGNTNAGTNDLFVVKYKSSGTKQWTKQLGSASSDFANGFYIDSSGNVYVSGATYGGLDGNTNAGNSDLFVVKYNSSGTKQWTKQLGTAEYDEARGVATDLSGNVYVVGGTKGKLAGASNSGRTDVFLIKYNSSGTKQWTKSLGSNENDLANGVTTDSSGNFYVTGFTYKYLDGNTSAGSSDLFVVKYNSSGTKKWTRQLGSSSRDHARGVATDSSGNVYVTGDTYGGVDGNTNAGYNDLFVVKYNSSGTKQWTKQFGTPSSDLADGVATDSSGNVYVVGYTYGDLDGNTNTGASDIFVVKYNSSGTKQWTKQLGSSMRY